LYDSAGNLRTFESGCDCEWWEYDYDASGTLVLDSYWYDETGFTHYTDGNPTDYLEDGFGGPMSQTFTYDGPEIAPGRPLLSRLVTEIYDDLGDPPHTTHVTDYTYEFFAGTPTRIRVRHSSNGADAYFDQFANLVVGGGSQLRHGGHGVGAHFEAGFAVQDDGTKSHGAEWSRFLFRPKTRHADRFHDTVVSWSIDTDDDPDVDQSASYTFNKDNRIRQIDYLFPGDLTGNIEFHYVEGNLLQETWRFPHAPHANVEAIYEYGCVETQLYTPATPDTEPPAPQDAGITPPFDAGWSTDGG
jgi:hypothetical protein